VLLAPSAASDLQDHKL